MKDPISIEQPVSKTVNAVSEVKKQLLIWTALISLFYVVFLWGFWHKGVDALGFNATVFGLLALSVFLFADKERKTVCKNNLFWLIPILFMVLSFSMFENPFLKSITILLLPILFALFFNYSVLEKNTKHRWNLFFISEITNRILQFFSTIGRSLYSFYKIILPGDGKKKAVIRKTLIGVLLFFLIAIIVVIPLLSAADPAFQEYTKHFMYWFENLISWVFIRKFIFFVLLSVFILSSFLAWTKKFHFKTEESTFKMDDIISGIVIGGILLLYLLFIALQIGHLWVDQLPVVFEKTESLVKSGFWQLLTLSVLNIIFFFIYYRNTKPFVQKILVAFTFASLLLLLSAGQRMFLYVFYYGFSYEKFFASYTVLYCVLLFIWLITSLFRKKKADIVKFVVILFLWMYSIMTIFPVEQVIFKTNIALAERKNTRIYLYELRMLSSDVFPIVEEYLEMGVLNKEKWREWVEEEKGRVENKMWYERNVSVLRL